MGTSFSDLLVQQIVTLIFVSRERLLLLIVEETIIIKFIIVYLTM